MSNLKIKTRDNHGLVVQNSNLVINNNTHDLLNSISEKLRAGKIDEAIDILNNMKKSVAGHHPLYPYYSTEVENRNGNLVFVSKPNSKEAIDKFPPIYKGKMTVPEKYKNFESINPLLDYSYRNQVDIDVNIKEFRKFLGDLDDPYQDEMFQPENLQNMKFKIIPKKFPKARPFKIVFSNSSHTLDYILLRAERVTENDEIILSNKEQDIGVCITFRVNFRSNRLDFNIRVKEEYKRDVYANLEYINFMINCNKAKQLKVVALEGNQEFMSGFFDDVNFESRFGDTKKEAKFLEDLKVIEDFYSMKIELTDNVMVEDVMNAEMLAKGIKGQDISGNYVNLDSEFRITNESKNSIKDLYNKTFMLSYEMHDYEIEILNQSFKVSKVIQTIKKIKMADEEKVLKKIEVLDDGDLIKIRFIPANGETIEHTDEFYFDSY